MKALMLFFLAGVIFVPGLLSPEAEITSARFVSFEKPDFIEKEVIVTAYSPPLFPLNAATFSGKPVGWGVIAVDPRVIPLGSVVFLPKIFPGKKFFALDTGKKIKGSHIDIWLPTEKMAKKWGRRKALARINYGAF